LPSAKQILEQGAFPLLGWQNQIGRREPSVIRDARAFVENVVRMSRSLYERRIGIGPVIHVHDAAAAVDDKNNDIFVKPISARLFSAAGVDSHVLRCASVPEQWELRIGNLGEPSDLHIGAFTSSKCFDALGRASRVHSIVRRTWRPSRARNSKNILSVQISWEQPPECVV